MKEFERRDWLNAFKASVCAGLLALIVAMTVFIAIMSSSKTDGSIFLKSFGMTLGVILVVFFLILPVVLRKAMPPDFYYAIGNVNNKFIRIRLSEGNEYNLKGEVVCKRNAREMTLIDSKGTMISRMGYDDNVIRALRDMGVTMKVKRNRR